MTPTRWTVPSILSATRLLGVPVLVVLVERRMVAWFVALYAVLGLTDYLDGKLARARNQTSPFGSMLDSVADIAYYVGTVFFAWRLFPGYLTPNIPWVIAALAMYALLVLISRLRVGRVLLPHTHLSRLAGLLAVLVFAASFVMDTTLALRGVIVLYAASFVEQVAMVLIYGDIPLDTRTILWLRREAARAADAPHS